MRQTNLFTKTRREAPHGEEAKNAQLLIRAGYIYKEMAGAYAFLPLGLRVLEKIKGIVREEMDTVGGQEILMTTLQRKELWESTNRWNDEIVDVWFKSMLAAGGEVGFGWSHEEPIGEMMKGYVSSFRDLPIFVYQFQNKLRNELRAKSGVMRGREFIMKDMYSFSRNEEEHQAFYNASIDAYHKVFDRIGIGEDTFLTFAPGGAFTEYSHEFQTITGAGEDVIYINREKNIAINEEVMNPKTLEELDVSEDELEKVATAEVGNIFNFGTSKAEELGLFYKDENGDEIPVHMGSYGIGVTRLMGVITEKYADDNGLVWPESVAPFKVHLVGLNLEDQEVRDYANSIYSELTERGVDVLFDDRVEARPGEKFADSDLIGIPYRVVVSKRTKESGSFEVVTRMTGDTQNLTEEDLLRDFTAA